MKIFIHNILKLLFSITVGIYIVQTSYANNLIAGSSCPVAGSGPRVVYLSEVMPKVCNDATQLQNIIFNIGSSGTLIIDKACVLNAGLRLPSRFTLKGIGIGLEGQLSFNHYGIALSVCQQPARSRYVTISDLDLYGPYRDGGRVLGNNSKGISLANADSVYLSNIRVSHFSTGVMGSNTYSVFIRGSNISANKKDNIQIGYAANGWRIRDSIVSQAGRWGINVLGEGDADPLLLPGDELWQESNDLLIDGVRLESNGMGGIRTNARATRITNTRLEFNGHGIGAPQYQGIRVDSNARQTRILTNMFSSNCIVNLGQNTKTDFNIFDLGACIMLGIE